MKTLNGVIKQAYGRTGIELNDSPEAKAIATLTGKKLIMPNQAKALNALGFDITVKMEIPTFEGVNIVTSTPDKKG